MQEVIARRASLRASLTCIYRVTVLETDQRYHFRTVLVPAARNSSKAMQLRVKSASAGTAETAIAAATVAMSNTRSHGDLCVI
jgi:hypothetical protein